MAKPQDVLIEYPDGAQYSCASPAIAAKAHPNARIVRYMDGAEYEGAKPEARRPARRKQATPATDPVTSGPDPDTEDTTNGAADEG